MLSATKRSAGFMLLFVLLMTLLLPVDMLPSTGFAQATSLLRPSCSRFHLIQPVSCLSPRVQTSVSKKLFSLHLHRQAGGKTQASTSLTVQAVGVFDMTGNNQTTFVPGETVIYAALINNTSSNAITATFTFTVPASSAECNFTLTGTGLSVPTGQSTWEAISNLCGDEQPATYTFQVTVTDQSSPSDTSSNSGPFTVNADNIQFPSVWHGKLCDTDNYSGSFQLGTANYRGIPACGPRPLFDPPYHDVGQSVVFVPGSEGELEWECVEHSMRFMYLTYGISPYNSPGGNNVVDNYPPGVNNVLVPVPNGTGSLPLPGDVLSYTTNHTSVVLSLAFTDTNGDGEVYVLEQNNSATGRATLPMQGGSISGIKNWLHHTLDLWPQTASPGATVLLSAEGFPPNAPITFSFGTLSTQTTADSNGFVVGTFTVPQVPGATTYTISLQPTTATPGTSSVFYVP
jgi:hypothetical protein